MGASTVLLVEDDEDLRESVKAVLEDGGFRVQDAAACKSGISILRTNKIDFLLTDLHILGGSGFELAAEARSRDIPVLIVTGFNAPPNLLGFDVLMKPVNPFVLVDRIRSILRLTHA